MTDVADVGDFEEHLFRKLPLHAQTVLHGVGVLELGIDAVNGALQCTGVWRAVAQRGEVAVVELRVGEEGSNIDLVEGGVTLSAVVEAAVAATNDGLLV